jgi:hypothetical protein
LITGNSFELSVDKYPKLQNSRLFHIDGGHFLEVVLNDISIAQQSVSSGGIIIIDDYWHSGFPEVSEAVNRYFSTATRIRAVPFMTGINKIFLCDVSFKTKVMQRMSSSLETKTIKLLGYDALCCDMH